VISISNFDNRNDNFDISKHSFISFH